MRTLSILRILFPCAFACALGYISRIPQRFGRLKSLQISTDKASSDETVSNDGDEMTEMIKLIIQSVEAGKQDELAKAGLKVTTKSERESLDEKLKNPQIQEKVLGPMDADELEIMKLLDDTMTSYDEWSGQGCDADLKGLSVEIDPLVYEELKQAALVTIDSIRGQGSAMATLFDNNEQFYTEIDITAQSSKSTESTTEGFGSSIHSKRSLDQSVWGSIGGTESLLSPIPDDSSPTVGSMPFHESSANIEVEEEEDNSFNNELAITTQAGGADLPPSPIPLATPPTISMLELRGLAEAQAAAARAAEEESATQLEGQQQQQPAEQSQLERTFGELLKASMQEAEVVTIKDDSKDSATAKNMLAAVESGDLSQIDVKSLLGEALQTLTDELGIDMQSELGKEEAMGQMQAILSSSMTELAANMKEIDEQSMVLYQNLATLEQDLRKETEEFEERKEAEIDDLLQSQMRLQDEFSKSQEKMLASAQQLERVMKDLDENADVLTAVALFPVKSTDKKVAFVLGLVPFDILQLWAVRSTDFSDLLTVFTQACLCLACWNHYGIVRAVLNGNKNPFVKLPPPPEI